MRDLVQVTRLVTYRGDREKIERQIAGSIHGTREYGRQGGEVSITAQTLHEFPETDWAGLINEVVMPVLKDLVERPGCMCGAFDPETWVVSLNSAEKEPCHQAECPGARALSLGDALDKLVGR